MENYSWLLVLAAVIIVIAMYLLSRSKDDEAVHEKRLYTYLRRDHIMTEAESHLFRRLEEIAKDRYYVFPQVHLSSLLDHKVENGQSWKGALSAIQRKSVDFVLVDKETLETMYAVELDDSTHDRPDRQERDDKVAGYLKQVHIPFVRFRNVQSMTNEQIETEFRRANESRESTS